LAIGICGNIRALQQQYGVKGARGKEDIAAIEAFQAGEGVKVDGKAGPGTLLKVAQYASNLPLVVWWPTGATQKNVTQYKADLNAIAAATTDPMRANELRASADREKGQAGVG
jgi:peptidoglycan hydrolase-like protein with peptidoglycan-binding domain